MRRHAERKVEDHAGGVFDDAGHVELAPRSWAVPIRASLWSAGARGGRVAGLPEAEFEMEALRC
jgi:hypothetical protein